MHSDLNCLSVVQFAVDILKVKHIIICGHNQCSGVTAAVNDLDIGICSNWLLHINDLNFRYRAQLNLIKDKGERIDKLCEINTA